MLHVFTIGAGELSNFEYLKTTADFSELNINFATLDKWGGFFDKINVMYDLIKNLPDNDIICFVDGFDVLSLSDNNEILEKFLKFDCDLLLSAEANAFPVSSRIRYPKSTDNTCFKFVNSGGFIGYKKILAELYTWKSPKEILHICDTCGGDQGYFIEYYLNNLDKNIKLDTRGTIFLNLYGISWKEIAFNNGRAINTVLNEKPCFLHFNGHTYFNANDVNMLPIIVDKIKKSATTKEILNIDEYPQNFNKDYYKRNQLNDSVE